VLVEVGYESTRPRAIRCRRRMAVPKPLFDEVAEVLRPGLRKRVRRLPGARLTARASRDMLTWTEPHTPW
jgi:hypothetical protein